MPGALSWSQYLLFSAAALTSMLLGASVVHNIYKPNLVSTGTINIQIIEL